MTQGVPVVIAALIAAFIAVFTNSQAQRATNVQLHIAEQGQKNAEQGQITDRYNAAITNLGSRSIEVRLGGIYALQRLMQDSPRDQPTVVAVLCAFVRDQAPLPAKALTVGRALNYRQPTDIQAALTVVGTRDTVHDSRTTVVDLNHGQLADSELGSSHLAHADLFMANLTAAKLAGADLTGAAIAEGSVPAGWRRDPGAGRLTRDGTNSGSAPAN